VPATEDPVRDLEIFEKLMAMDDESFVIRWKRRPKPKEILGALSIASIADYFTMEPEGILPAVAPVDWSNPAYDDVKVTWRGDLTELERRRLEAEILPKTPYRERVGQALRPEEVMDTVHDHIWDAVNAHLGTAARSFPELIEHLGIMRYGHRPQVADTFCGSGQIPFEAARLGCDVYASDLNPVACMLTWGGFYIVGGAKESREKLALDQEDLMRGVQTEIEALDVESDSKAGTLRYIFTA
jgi:putative DNA methylase